MKIKYNRPKYQFNLIKGKFISRSSRKEEINEIDDCLMNSASAVFVTFKDNKDIMHKDEKVDTDNMFTWYNGSGKGDTNSFVWDFPINSGHLYIKAKTSECFFGKDDKHVMPINKKFVCIEIK